MINEDLAKRAKENYSFSEYKKGSATSEYNQMVLEATKKIEIAKEKVSEEAKEKLDNLLIRYKTKLANWINKHNANGANHVSWVISGPANYNMRKHKQWESREGKLWDEYNEIQDIDSKINRIINGDKIIKSDDENALEKLKDKLQKAQEKHQSYKDYNKQARKEGKQPHSSYVLTNSNQNIRQIKQRIAQLERLEQQREVAKEQGNKEIKINGVKIIDNLEANRIQIIFGFKPDAEIRDKLKRNGFRWSPKNEAWQHYRQYAAVAISIVNNIK